MSESIKSLKINKQVFIEIGIYILLIGVAAAIRFWQLDLRAIHHDESLHLFYSWKFFKGQGYFHDPMMHGPFQFFGNRLVFSLFGVSEYTARVLYAFWGTLLVALPYFLRRELGRLGAILVATMLAFSPSFLYFSRFARNDIYIAFWSLLIVIFLWRYIQHGRFRYLCGAAAVLALSFATKETTFLFIATLGGFFLLWRFGELWKGVKDHFSLSRLSLPASCLIMIISLVLPLYTAGISFFQRPLGIVLANADEKAGLIGAPLEVKGTTVAVVAVILFLELAMVIGFRRWGWRYLVLFGIFYGIYVALFTTYLTNLAGLGTGIWGSMSYWIVQHGQNRLAQPWFYYFLLLSYYEFLPLLLGVLGGIYFIRRRDIFAVFLTYWAVVGFILYAQAGEKAPWLVLHLTLPLILLGGKFAGDILVKWSRWRKGLLILGLAIILAFTIKLSFQASYQKNDVPTEALVYAGGAYDLKPLVSRIEKLAQDSGQGKGLKITIDSPLSWPWVWYLRDYTNVDYPELGKATTPPQGDVLLAAPGNEAKLSPYLDKYSPGERFHQIIWFPEEYKEWKASDFLQPVGWQRWWGYFWSRRTVGPYYSSDGTAYFPK